jgi:hypothetical protein
VAFTKTFRVESITYSHAGKCSVLVEQPESNILPVTGIAPPCKVQLCTDKKDEFDLTPLDALFEISFKRTWPEEKS